MADRFPVFLITGEEESVLVDTGPGIGDLRSAVFELVDSLPKVLLTHTHWDHIGNASQFEEVMVSERELPPDQLVKIDSLSTEFVHRPHDFVEMVQQEGHEIPSSVNLGDYSIDPAAASPIRPGTILDLGDRRLEVIETPGHSPGHLAILDQEESILYGGDIIHVNRGVFVQFQDSDFGACVESFHKIRELYEEDAFDRLVTSHNAPIETDELSIIDEFLEGFQEIRNDELSYKMVTTRWGGQARKYQVSGRFILTKTSLS